MWFFFRDVCDETAAKLAPHFPVMLFDRLEFTEYVRRYGFKAGDAGRFLISAISGESQVFIDGRDWPSPIDRQLLNFWIETGVALWSIPQQEWARRKSYAKHF